MLTHLFVIFKAKSLPIYQALSSNQEPIRALKENVTEYAETCIEPFEVTLILFLSVFNVLEICFK